MGPGETSQGLAVGKFLKAAGETVSFIVLQEELLSFIGSDFSSSFISESTEIKNKIDKDNFDFVLLCNSKMFRGDRVFQDTPPINKPIVATLDSNWLFNQPEKYSIIKWADHYFLNFPQIVFENGLVKNGGRYQIPTGIMSRIVNTGLIPSYEKPNKDIIQETRKRLNINFDQKLIFAYIGSGTTKRGDFYKKCTSIFNSLYEKYDNRIKIIFVQYCGPSYEWLAPQSSRPLNSSEFYNYLAASDLVFQHQGLGTLEQAISANIPVIANVNRPAINEKVNAHAWEVEPFQRSGLCKMHYYDDSIFEIVSSIEALIFGKEGELMSELQSRNSSSGENIIYKEIKRHQK